MRSEGAPPPPTPRPAPPPPRPLVENSALRVFEAGEEGGRPANGSSPESSVFTSVELHSEVPSTYLVP
ncbi:unnamed protein product [Rangifer tarandus platyrhynchus]|uniref:Uncharacterized protein n=1 Tax=Rangifer tarandus platyrhynchus TaxID=3082113 RepID=A0AC59YCR1_RANTA